MKLPNDPILLELVPEFISSWEQELASVLPYIVASQDNQELYRFGHTLKGSARQFGFDELAELGAQLMDCARANEWELGDLPRAIHDVLSRIQQLWMESDRTNRSSTPPEQP